MPLSEQEWDEADEIDHHLRELYNILKDGYPNAYSRIELTQKLFKDEDDEMDGIVKSLFNVLTLSLVNTLIEDGRAEMRVVEKGDEGTTYYRRS